MVKKNTKGNLTLPRGASPEPHELEAVAILLSRGYDVTFIAPTRLVGHRSPDIEMFGIQWEIKTPFGNSKTTIFNAMKRGTKQSKYLILDLRRTKITDSRAIKDIKVSMRKTASIKRVLVISKGSALIDIS